MDISSIKVLVVDDDPDIVEILKYNLKNSGYSVKSAGNGVEAIKKAKKFIPDIILMDVMMPEMSGIEACEEIKILINSVKLLLYSFQLEVKITLKFQLMTPELMIIFQSL